MSKQQHLKKDEICLKGSGLLDAISTIKKAKLLSRASDVIGKTAGIVQKGAEYGKQGAEFLGFGKKKKQKKSQKKAKK